MLEPLTAKPFFVHASALAHAYPPILARLRLFFQVEDFAGDFFADG